MGRRITVASSKAKGRRFQQEIAKDISELIDLPFGRDLLIDSRPMGQSGCDIILVGEAREKFPFSVEAKNQENMSIQSWIRQAKTNIMPDTHWILFFKKNRLKPLACFDSALIDKYNLPKPHITYDYRAWRVLEWVRESKSVHKDKPWSFNVVSSDEVVTVMEKRHFFTYLSKLIKGGYDL